MGGWLSPKATMGRLLWPVARLIVDQYHIQLCMSLISLRDAVRFSSPAPPARDCVRVLGSQPMHWSAARLRLCLTRWLPAKVEQARFVTHPFHPAQIATVPADAPVPGDAAEAAGLSQSSR